MFYFLKLVTIAIERKSTETGINKNQIHLIKEPMKAPHTVGHSVWCVLGKKKILECFK